MQNKTTLDKGKKYSSSIIPFFQAKFTINKPNDIYEQEADSIADRVMRMSDSVNEHSFFKPKPLSVTSIQRQCKHCEGEENIQMKEDADPGKGMTAPSIMNSVINSGGQPLDRGTKNFMESRFGYDFGNVQIHNDSLAHESSRDINALAYTHSNHVVFGVGQYRPNTNSGKQLLAHELAHVVQQSKKNDDEGLISRKPSFNDVCGDYYECQVTVAVDAAKKLVDNAIKSIEPVANGTITSGNIIDLLNVHFRVGAVADAGIILDNYRQVKAELDSNIQYNCFAKDPEECKSDEGNTGALTGCSKGDEVDLCNFFFNTRCLEKARELVHENTHHLGFCMDYTYVDRADYMQLSHDKAMRNPDNYAQFTVMAFKGPLDCDDCSPRYERIKKK